MSDTYDTSRYSWIGFSPINVAVKMGEVTSGWSTVGRYSVMRNCYCRNGPALGTPISQLSGRPGHAGYDRFCEIASSWGYD